MDWIRLSEDERNVYREKAKVLVEAGEFEGFTVESLAMHLQWQDQ